MMGNQPTSIFFFWNERQAIRDCSPMTLGAGA
jgi:hypothetical protein